MRENGVQNFQAMCAEVLIFLVQKSGNPNDEPRGYSWHWQPTVGFMIYCNIIRPVGGCLETGNTSEHCALPIYSTTS